MKKPNTKNREIIKKSFLLSMLFIHEPHELLSRYSFVRVRSKGTSSCLFVVEIFFLLMSVFSCLEFSLSRSPWEGDHVPYIHHARNVLNQPFKTEPEA